MLKNLVDIQSRGQLDIPRYDDIINTRENQEENETNTRTANEIISNISNILNKLGN